MKEKTTKGGLKMKKIFLGLVLTAVMLFMSCSVDSDKIYSRKGIVVSTGSIVFNNIEGRMVTWKKTKGTMDFLGLVAGSASRHWFLYPAERVPDNIAGYQIEITYQVTGIAKVPIVFVKEIKILGKAKIF